MKDSKLIILLGSLSRKELNEFGKFIKSPFFTTGLKVSPKILLGFFNILKDNYPSFKSTAFTKEIIYGKLFPASKYKDEHMRVLMSVMLSLAEQFLSYSEFKTDSFENKKYLLYSLISRKNDRLFEYHEKRALKTAEVSLLGPTYYYRKYLLNTISHKFKSTRKGLVKHDNFQEIEDNFFYFTLAKSMDIYGLLQNEKSVFNKNFRLNFYTEIVNHLKKNNYNDNPSIELLINKLFLITTEDEVYFRRLNELKNKYKNSMEPQLLYDIMTDLTNYCIKRSKMGDKSFRRVEFELNREFISEKIYIVNEYIRDITFLNMIANACRLKELDWAENLIKNFSDMLEPETRDENRNFAMGLVNFNRKNYADALKDFSKITTEYTHLKFSVKNFMLMIYYETGAYESSFSLIDSYRHFLANETSVPGYIKKSNASFLKFYNELIKLKTGSETFKAEEFKGKLNSSEYCVHKDWLLKKAEKI